MERDRKKVFIKALIEGGLSEILDKIPYMPENWDGIELREYIADYFSQQGGYMEGKRKRMYKNEIAVNSKL